MTAPVPVCSQIWCLVQFELIFVGSERQKCSFHSSLHRRSFSHPCLSPEPALTMVLSDDRRLHMPGFSGINSSLLAHVSSPVILCLVTATILYSETQQSNDFCFVFSAHDSVSYIIVHNFQTVFYSFYESFRQGSSQICSQYPPVLGDLSILNLVLPLFFCFEAGSCY